jgi:DNA repair exonuclease SbcCD nuclease subunit
MSKKPIAILVNDLHLNKDNTELIENIISQITDKCLELGIKDILIGGDVFTNRSGQPLNCLVCWRRCLDKIRSLNLSVTAIPGNHDKTDGDDESSYLDVYSKDMNIFSNGGVKVFSKTVIAFIPYFKDERWLNEYDKVCVLIKRMLKNGEIDKFDSKFLITHSGFDGVVNNDGTKVESLIKPSLFKDWDNVLIGHYHNASKLADNVIYTGSAYQNNYGETSEDKGCTVLFDDGSIRQIPLVFPRYIKETIDVNDKDTLKNLIEKYEGEENNHIRFIFRGKKVDANKVDLSELSKRGIEARFEAEETEDAINSSESDVVLSYDKKSIMKDFTKFCSDNKIKGKFLKYGLNLIKSI